MQYSPKLFWVIVDERQSARPLPSPGLRGEADGERDRGI